VTSDDRMERAARFVVVRLAGERAELVLQGTTAGPVFRRLFLEPYGMEGERLHPGEGATVHGVLLATWESAVVTVPIWTWPDDSGASTFLCQASDDGRAPAISVVAGSEPQLLDRLVRLLEGSDVA
jgi:hypothetical protein